MKIIVLLTTFLFSLSSFAGPGHGHSHGHAHAVKKEKTVTIGMKHIARLIKAGKIDQSWNKASHDNSVKKKFNGKNEWVVTFKNESGVKGKKLYIFLSNSGNFIAANFTGK